MMCDAGDLAFQIGEHKEKNAILGGVERAVLVQVIAHAFKRGGLGGERAEILQIAAVLR